MSAIAAVDLASPQAWDQLFYHGDISPLLGQEAAEGIVALRQAHALINRQRYPEALAIIARQEDAPLAPAYRLLAEVGLGLWDRVLARGYRSRGYTPLLIEEFVHAYYALAVAHTECGHYQAALGCLTYAAGGAELLGLSGRLRVIDIERSRMAGLAGLPGALDMMPAAVETSNALVDQWAHTTRAELLLGHGDLRAAATEAGVGGAGDLLRLIDTLTSGEVTRYAGHDPRRYGVPLAGYVRWLQALAGLRANDPTVAWALLALPPTGAPLYRVGLALLRLALVITPGGDGLFWGGLGARQEFFAALAAMVHDGAEAVPVLASLLPAPLYLLALTDHPTPALRVAAGQLPLLRGAYEGGRGISVAGGCVPVAPRVAAALIARGLGAHAGHELIEPALHPQAVKRYRAALGAAQLHEDAVVNVGALYRAARALESLAQARGQEDDAEAWGRTRQRLLARSQTLAEVLCRCPELA